MKYKEILPILFFSAFVFFSLYSQNKNNKEFYNTIKLGKQWLVIIGINNYLEWNNLQYPADDAKKIKNILKKKYQIDNVLELYNQQATKENIIKIFFQLQQETSLDDSILIYYAGHGYFDEVTNNGFWIPADGGKDRFKQKNWLANSLLKGLISNIKAQHILLLSDSCFSGNILSINRGQQLIINNDYFHKAYQRTSRQVLTSGARETVPDFSEFSLLLRQTLEKNKEPVIDPHMLYTNIRLGITKTTPLLGVLNESGHQEGGSYLLFLKKEFQSDNKRLIFDNELTPSQLKTHINDYLADLAVNKMFDLTLDLLKEINTNAVQAENKEIIQQSQQAIATVKNEKTKFEKIKISEIDRIQADYSNDIEPGLRKLSIIREEVSDTNSEFPEIFTKLKNAENALSTLKQKKLAKTKNEINPKETGYQRPNTTQHIKPKLSSHKIGGIISSVLGSAILITGGAFFCFSVIYNDYLENRHLEYTQYVNEKKLIQGFFFSGIAGMAAGAIGISVSIPLLVYKRRG